MNSKRELAVGLDAVHQLVELLLPCLVNTRSRLVEQQYGRLAKECKSDEQSLELTPGIRSYQLVARLL